MAEVKRTPIEPSLIARVSAGVRYVLTGHEPSWFGPQQPMLPVVSETEKPSVLGRQLDFPVGYNTRITPRTEEAISFGQMRALADGYDLLRLVIETRKDQMAKLKWTIRPKDKQAISDSRCDKLIDFFKMPDKEHSWDDWLRMLLEDLLVLDAPTIYIRPTKGGDLYALEPIDGSTIKRVIDDMGRTPIAPDPAYQQILKGLPAIDYSIDELIYKPRNPRTHKIYGYSPVEQIIMTVNIALRRQVNQLSYYTEGNTPNLIFNTPAEWNPDQIAQFQDWWNKLNQSQSKHIARFIPGGVSPHDTKAGALKDEMEDWLARIVCFAFSINPTPFIKQQNRATADNAHEQSMQEGLEPTKNWVKSLIDLVIFKYFQISDLEFSWEEEESLDPVDQSTIQDKKIRNGSLTINEARAKDGEPPIEGGDIPLIFTSGGAVPLDMVLNPPEPLPPSLLNTPNPDKELPPNKEALGKAKKALAPIDRDRSAIRRIQKEIKSAMADFFQNQQEDISKQVIDAYVQANKVDKDKIEQILADLKFTGWAVIVGEMEDLLKQIYEDGGIEALAQLKIAAGNSASQIDVDQTLSQVNEKALEYASQRSAELVGMKRDESGELIPNPDAQWQITESTREMLRSDVARALEEGMSNDQLADLIAENYAFSDERAEMIARTETAFADVAGNLSAYKESGLAVAKQWIVGAGCCDDCQELDGVVVGMDEEFPNDGGDGPPLHPACRCDVLPVLNDEEPD